MKKTTLLKVLVVYSSKIASSALLNKTENINPFALDSQRAGYAQSYAYFLDECKKQNLQAALSTSDDIIGSGTCKSFWTHDKEGWNKVKTPCFSANIFDKFSPTNLILKGKRELMFHNPLIKPFNNRNLYHLFFDKYETYTKLAKYAIPTVVIDSKVKNGISTALGKLSGLMGKASKRVDFESNFVLKDRNGAGGNRVYKITDKREKRIEQIIKRCPNNSFILQPMVKFERGFEYGGKEVRADIRLIFMGRKIVQTYVRIAAVNEFRCNDHQGGALHHLDIKNIPSVVIQMARKVERELPPHDSLYALDFIIGNSGRPYFLEGNTGPGLDWKMADKEEELKSKQLIRLIVRKMAERASGIKNEKRNGVGRETKINYLFS